MFAKKEQLAQIERKQHRPAATKDNSGLTPIFCTTSASSSSSALMDTNLDKSQQTGVTAQLHVMFPGPGNTRFR